MAAAASLVGPLESRVAVVALVSTIAVALTGGLVKWMAQTRYVDAVTSDAPVATWQWEPPSSPVLDASCSPRGCCSALPTRIAATGCNRSCGPAWQYSGSVAARRGPMADRIDGATPELRVHDAGLVKQRPYTRSIVLWDDVAHVRLREDELVLDRGLFDVRFERDELAALETAHEEIERRLPNRAAG